MMDLNFPNSAGLLLLSVAISVPTFAAPPDFNLIEMTYERLDFSKFEADYRPAGLSIGGSKELASNWFVFGSYAYRDGQPGLARVADGFYAYETTIVDLGAGYHRDISDHIGLFAAASYINAGVSLFGGIAGRPLSVDQEGYSLTVGIRGNVTERLELSGHVGAVDVGDYPVGFVSSSTAIGFGAHFGLTSNLGWLANWEANMEGDNSLSFGVRLGF